MVREEAHRLTSGESYLRLILLSEANTICANKHALWATSRASKAAAVLLSTKPAQRGTARLADRADDSERLPMDSMAERLGRSTCQEDRLGD